MQAIVTKYIGPTDTHGSRIKAKCCGGYLYHNIDNAFSIEKNMEQAAYKLVKKLDWNLRGCKLVQGTLPNGSDVFVIYEPW